MSEYEYRNGRRLRWMSASEFFNRQDEAELAADQRRERRLRKDLQVQIDWAKRKHEAEEFMRELNRGLG